MCILCLLTLKPVLTPLALLDSRMIQKGASSVAQVQVHWPSLPFSCKSSLGQAVSQGGKNVMKKLNILFIIRQGSMKREPAVAESVRLAGLVISLSGLTFM